MTESYGHFAEFHPRASNFKDRYPPGFVLYRARNYALETQPNCLSLKYLTRGSMHYETDGYRLCLRPGELALVSSDQMILGSASKRHDTEGVSVFFPDEIVFHLSRHKQDFSKNLLVKVPAFLPKIQCQISAIGMLSQSECCPRQQEQLLQELTLSIASQLLQLYSISENVTARKEKTRHQHAARVLAARTFMDEAFCSGATIEEIAYRFGFSRFQFARLFKSAFGEQPSRYLENRRIKRAEYLISTTSMSLSAIAESLGYVDYPTFSKAFRRVRSVSPCTARRILNQLSQDCS